MLPAQGRAPRMASSTEAVEGASRLWRRGMGMDRRMREARAAAAAAGGGGGARVKKLGRALTPARLSPRSFGCGTTCTPALHIKNSYPLGDAPLPEEDRGEGAGAAGDAASAGPHLARVAVVAGRLITPAGRRSDSACNCA